MGGGERERRKSRGGGRPKRGAHLTMKGFEIGQRVKDIQLLSTSKEPGMEILFEEPRDCNSHSVSSLVLIDTLQRTWGRARL